MKILNIIALWELTILPIVGCSKKTNEIIIPKLKKVIKYLKLT